MNTPYWEAPDPAHQWDELMESCDEIWIEAYGNYPESYDTHNYTDDETDNWYRMSYEGGAHDAYEDNPQRLMNHLIGCVL